MRQVSSTYFIPSKKKMVFANECDDFSPDKWLPLLCKFGFTFFLCLRERRSWREKTTKLTNIKACIFDLDGVIVDTAHYHFLAWKRLAKTLGFELTEDYNEKLKGVSRMDSLDIILKLGTHPYTPEEKQEMAERKNRWYLEYIQQIGPQDALPGVVDFLKDLKKEGIQCAIGSSSKNARPILDSLQLTNWFEAIVDGNDLAHAKPHPEVFLKAAGRLGVLPEEAVVFEDAFSGVQAAKAADMFCVGVGSPDILHEADLVLPSLEGFSTEKLQLAVTQEPKLT